MKKILILASLALVVFGSSDAFAQCRLLGRFGALRAQRSTYWRYDQYEPSFEHYGTGLYKSVNDAAPCGPVVSQEEPADANGCEPVSEDDPIGAYGSENGSAERSCDVSDRNDGPCRLAGGIRKVVNNVVENVYLARVNAVRVGYGLRKLELDKELDAQCAQHCRNMASAGYIYHAPSCGYEIVASNGETGIECALWQWKRSAAHAAILLNPNLTRCGVQTYRDAYGRNFCAMRFR